MAKSGFKKRVIAGIILIASLIVVGIFALLVFFLIKNNAPPADEGAVVVVEVNQVRVAEYPLYEDGVYELNGGTNVLTVKDGKAWISEANCPGYQDCVMFGEIHSAGFGHMIVCLPNRVQVYIEEK